MGAFATLKAREIDFGAQQSYLQTLLVAYGESDIRDLFYDEAKEVLLQDLQVALNRRPNDADDMADIDEVVEAQEPRLQRALATKQLALIFERQQKGEGSHTFSLWHEFRRQYEQQRAGFAGLTRRQGTVRVRSVGQFR